MVAPWTVLGLLAIAASATGFVPGHCRYRSSSISSRQAREESPAARMAATPVGQVSGGRQEQGKSKDWVVEGLDYENTQLEESAELAGDGDLMPAEGLRFGR